MIVDSRLDDDMAIPVGEIGPLLELIEAAGSLGGVLPTIVVLRGQLRALGVNHFSLRVAQRDSATTGRYAGVWSYPREYNRVFTANHYGLSSAVLIAARTRRRPFNWFDVLSSPAIGPGQRRAFAEALDYGIGIGLTAPMHTPDGGFTSMSLSADPALDPSAETIRANAWALTLLGLGFVELTRPFLNGRAIALDDPLFVRLPGNDNEPPAGLVMPFSGGATLTSLEGDCLAWSSAGLTAWDISARFSLPQAAIDHAIESARLKLGAATRAHAVVKAIVARLIQP